MDKLFLQILNMSIISSYVILFIVIIRLVLKKAPKIFSYGLWIIPFLRLIFPISFESIFSLIRINTKTIPKNIIYSKAPEIQSGIRIVDNTVNRILPPPTTMGASINPIQIWIDLGSTIWLTGIFILLIYSIFNTIKLTKNLKSASQLYDNIYEIDNIETGFVFGLINPKIYIPINLSHIERSYIIKHEETHIKRMDHIIKFMAYMITVIHWFNPLVWIGFYLMGEDMELSCDESVIKEMGYEIKKDYSNSLLNLSTGRKNMGGSPIAFGENNTKSRIKNILNYKKPKLWVIISTIIIIIILSIGLLSNPPEYDNRSTIDELYELKNTKIGDNSKVGNIIYLLEFPEELKHRGMELFTNEEPYGLKINLELDTELQIDYTRIEYEDIWLFQSLVLFSLIDNLDYIIYEIEDSSNSYIDIVNIDRSSADNHIMSTMGYRVSEISKNKKRFVKFYQMWGEANTSSNLIEDTHTRSNNQYMAFINKIELDKDLIHIDEIEFLTENDEKRMEELGIDIYDMPNGFYIYDEDFDTLSFKLVDESKFLILNADEFNVKSGHKPVTKEEFLEYNESLDYSSLYIIVVKDGCVTSMEEYYLP